MTRRDRIAQLRQQRAAGSDVPRAIGAAVDERDIIEMMERRGIAEAAVIATDDNHNEKQSDEASSGIVDVVTAASGTVGVEATIVAAAAAAKDVAASDGGSGSSEASMSGSEEEDSEGSWSGEEDEEGGDSDIEEFYLKGGEGQMDEVEKKKKAAAEQKLVMVTRLIHKDVNDSSCSHSGSTREGASDEEDVHHAALRRPCQAQVHINTSTTLQHNCNDPSSPRPPLNRDTPFSFSPPPPHFAASLSSSTESKAAPPRYPSCLCPPRLHVRQKTTRS